MNMTLGFWNKEKRRKSLLPFFDEERKAILLIGGDKKGKMKDDFTKVRSNRRKKSIYSISIKEKEKKYDEKTAPH